ncbi:Tau-tubulin kinase 2 [Cytospora mali]|uniref:non-specific serine/threonine protein kinase n=1 Tax=Cytospora mali TaxID=578113 RepID=A0A194W9H4_CYTMA|nr:Tau-tubulin kinase 2 [Valsa mali]
MDTAESKLQIIQDRPIGTCLDALYNNLSSLIKEHSNLDSINSTDLQDVTLQLATVLLGHPASSVLPSVSRTATLRDDIRRFITSSSDFDFDRVKPLLATVLERQSDQELWDQVYKVVAELSSGPKTPPKLSHPTLASLKTQTPWTRNSGSPVNTNEHRKDLDKIIKGELGVMYADVPRFYQAFFLRCVPGLEGISNKVFDKCQEGPNPLFREGEGWTGWPQSAKEEAVLTWFADITSKLAAFTTDLNSTLIPRHRPVAQPTRQLGSETAAKRKLDIGFVNGLSAGNNTNCSWSEILVPGEFKSNPRADIPSKAWLDIARYVREVMAHQPTRRFVLSFTLCGSIMRVWEFDRSGAIASEKFDINENGSKFVLTIIAFLSMDKEQLGFDTTFCTGDGGKEFIEVQRDGSPETLIIDELIVHVPCIVGRATTCWKAFAQKTETTVVIKDSWQFTNRDNEGDMLCEVTKKGVENVARYYHHETVRIGKQDDTTQDNIRDGLNITNVEKIELEVLDLSSTSEARSSQQEKGKDSISPGSKRLSSQIDATLPASKRAKSGSRATDSPRRSSSQVDATLPASKQAKSGSKATDAPPLNRIHRRIIVRDYGKCIYKASSLSALLNALEGCIAGHESLYQAGFLHRDISINNLLMNEGDENPTCRRSFLIDLDMAIERSRTKASGAQGRTGTTVFMAIGILVNEQHSFRHDLESFFWVLFWICIHYDNRGKSRVVQDFEDWNYMSAKVLAALKKFITTEKMFLEEAKNFTPYYKPLIPWVNKLRGVVFPGGAPYEYDNEQLYADMRSVLREASKELAKEEAKKAEGAADDCHTE